MTDLSKTAPRARLGGHVARWALTLLLLTGAWFLVKVTLPEGSSLAPFPTVATIGEQASARNLVVTVTDVHAARRVTSSDGWSADGTWLVVDLEAASVQEPSLLSHANLFIGERTFAPTDRGTTFARHPLMTGVPQSGSLAFELPADALRGTATLRLGLLTADDGTVPLDGVIELMIDLDATPVEAEVPLQENGWAR